VLVSRLKTGLFLPPLVTNTIFYLPAPICI
jgi:hypothetical protein